MGLSASLATDYRYRGVSLSAEKPVLSLSASYDHASGIYAGVSASAAQTPHDGVLPLGYQLSLGYALRARSGANWDFGVSQLGYDIRETPRYRAAATELYGGVTVRNVSAHVYFSPDYFGEHAQTLYFDLNSARRLDDRWRLFGHVGMLAPVAHRAGSELDRPYYDARAGVAARVQFVEVQLAWTGVTPKPDYVGERPQARSAVVLSASYFF